MSSATSPRTPSPERTPHYTNDKVSESPDAIREIGDSQASKVQEVMTPPPSTQIPKSNGRTTQTRPVDQSQHALASPPTSVRPGPPVTSIGLYGEVPSPESVQRMDESQLRQLVAELLATLGEARVTVAHSKLQHNLLAMEKEEAAERAEVEHEATRREVQALQENSPLQCSGHSPQSPHASIQRSLQLALGHCRELQGENAMLGRRLRASKKLIAQLDGENLDLKDRNYLLRQRIKVNRDHLNEMQSTGAISIYGTPVTDYGTPPMRSNPRIPATGRPSRDLDTLLMAGQMLNGESTSVPSTPTPAKPRALQSQHVRGAYSLSSLPSLPATPRRPRPSGMDRDLTYLQEQSPFNYHISPSDPGAQMRPDENHLQREERDSTISVSENETGPDEEGGIRGSQASQRATSMLRRSLAVDKAPSATLGANTGKPIQGRLVGKVRKPRVAEEDQVLKHRIDDSPQRDNPYSSKKAKMTVSRDRVGLGIKDWSH